MRTISFTVYGAAKPKGSKRHVGHGVMVESSKALKPWLQQVSGVADSLSELPFEQHVPLRCRIDCYFERPKSATVKKRPGMTTKPDGDKLMRGIWDAVKGILIHDDSQFVDGQVRKFYGTPERAEITISDVCE